MATNYTTNPDATTSLTGWSKTGGGSLAFTSEGARWTPTAAASASNKLTITGKSSAPAGSLNVSGLKIRRNTAASGQPYRIRFWAGDVYWNDHWVDGVDFPVGVFITLPNFVGAYRPYTGEVPKVEIYGDDSGKAMDLTITSVDIYSPSDIPVGAQIDSNDAVFEWTQADNSLSATFKKSPGNEGVDKVSWTWGDGTAGVTGAAAGYRTTPAALVRRNPITHTFPARGRYTVGFTAANTPWSQDTLSGYTAEPTTVSSSQVVTVPAGAFQSSFTYQADYLSLLVDGGGSIFPSLDPPDSYDWDWGDGTPHGTGVQASHVYAQAGTYPVVLTLTTNATARSSASTNTVTMNAPPNTALYFTAVKSLTSVSFSSSTSTATSYAWNFGDGTTSSLAAPVHVYDSPGSYTVSLTVVDGGTTKTTTQVVTVVDTYRPLGDLLDALVLEIATPYAPGVIFNRLPNASGGQGAWGWSTPVSGSYVTASSRPDGPEDHGVPDSKLIYHSSGSGVQRMNSQPIRLAAGQYASAQVVSPYVEGYYRITVEALSSAGVVLGSSGYSGYQAAGTVTATRTTPYLLPTGTVFARMGIEFYSSTAGAVPAAGKILQVRNAMLAVAPTSAALTANPFISGRQWVNITGPTADVTVDRTALDVGTLSATVLESGYDPATSGTIRPGQPVRLRVKVEDALGNVVLEPLFYGTLTGAKVTYNPLARPTDPKSTRIALTATDGLSTLAQSSQPNGVALLAELPAILEAVGVPYEVNGSTSQVPTAQVVAVNTDASALDQVAITRDTSGGYAYVSRRGVLTAVDQQHLTTVPASLVDETVYSDLDAGFDTSSLINSVTIKWLRLTPASTDADGNAVPASTEEIPYGPYLDQASVDTWGLSAAEFTMQGVENPTVIAAKAAAILAANKTPVRQVKAATLPIRYLEDLSPAKALLDLYDLVQLNYARTGTAAPTRVTSVRHRITPDKWLVDLGFSPDGVKATPQEVPSPPAATGTGETATGGTAALTKFTPAAGLAATDVQAAVVEVVGKIPKTLSGRWTSGAVTANTPKSASITFPAGYFTAVPTIMVTAETSVPQRVSVSYTDAAVTGFTIYVTRDNTTSTTLSWLAIGT